MLPDEEQDEEIDAVPLFGYADLVQNEALMNSVYSVPMFGWQMVLASNCMAWVLGKVEPSMFSQEIHDQLTEAWQALDQTRNKDGLKYAAGMLMNQIRKIPEQYDAAKREAGLPGDIRRDAGYL